jgi:hypothetical protein
MVLAILAGIAIVGFFITLWIVLNKAKINKKKQDEFTTD